MNKNRIYYRFSQVVLGVFFSTCVLAQRQDTTKAKIDSVAMKEFGQTTEEDNVLMEKQIDSIFQQSELRRLSREAQRLKSTEKSEELSFVGIQAKSYVDSIVVRWAPSSRSLWLKGKRYGYFIIRSSRKSIDMPQNVFDSLLKAKNLPDEMFKPPTIKTLVDANNPIKPYDSAQWSSMLPIEDPFTLIAAGATLGALEFPLNKGFALKSKQDESIFGFILLAADLSRQAADGLGFRYVDADLEPGYTYSYQVFVADSLSQIPYDKLSEKEQQKRLLLAQKNSASNNIVNYTGQSEKLFIKNTLHHSMDHQIALQWPVSNNLFSGYHIERSDDGGNTFQQLNERVQFIDPTTPEDTTGMKLPPQFVFIDSVAQNYYEYVYKIYGIDAFADLTEPAIIRAQAQDLTSPISPVIRKGEFLKEDQEIRLTYEIKNIPDDLSEIYLEQSIVLVDSTFQKVKNLPVNSTDSILVYQPKPHEYNNYFKLVMTDINGNLSKSVATYVSVPDTIPPVNITGLIGKIDTTGLVSLNWDNDQESDHTFMGYRVYFANAANREFTQLTTKATPDNNYNYYITLKTLTEKIYYKVQAIDKSFNLSEFSPILEVAKPDTIAPVAAVFNPPKASELSIDLSWSLSPSQDVEQQLLKRRAVESGDSLTIEIDATVNLYQDTTAIKGILYEYQLVIVDDASLSSSSFPIRAKRMDKKQSAGVEELRIFYVASKKEILVEWFHHEKDDFRFVVYRGFGEENVKRFRSVDADTNAIRDIVSNPGKYSYAVKVVHKNGEMSLLSELVSIVVQ